MKNNPFYPPLNIFFPIPPYEQINFKLTSHYSPLFLIFSMHLSNLWKSVPFHKINWKNNRFPDFSLCFSLEYVRGPFSTNSVTEVLKLLRLKSKKSYIGNLLLNKINENSKCTISWVSSRKSCELMLNSSELWYIHIPHHIFPI